MRYLVVRYLVVRYLIAALAVGLGLSGGGAALPSRPGLDRTTSCRHEVGRTTSPSRLELAPASSPSRSAGYYQAPVSGPVRMVRGFSPPSTPYGPGHLGVDLAVEAGSVVLTAGAGVVRFAGQVAGRGVVVVLHPDGISTEYEPLAVLVRPGDRVAAGQSIGRLAGVHRGCPETGCLHWGARRGQAYIDPMSLLQPLGVVRLLPWDWVPPP